MMKSLPFLLLALAAGCGEEPIEEAPAPGNNTEVPTPVENPTDAENTDPNTEATETSPEAEPDTQEDRCCTQCAAASNKDPSGYDISIKPCDNYEGTVVNDLVMVDSECIAWFQEHPMTVADCRGPR